MPNSILLVVRLFTFTAITAIVGAFLYKAAATEIYIDLTELIAKAISVHVLSPLNL